MSLPRDTSGPRSIPAAPPSTPITDVSTPSSAERTFLVSCKEPYILMGGHVKATRKLKSEVPVSLIPTYILKLQKDLECGLISSSRNRLRWYNARALVRRYGLPVPALPRKKSTNSREYQRRWRANHAQYFAERRRRLRSCCMEEAKSEKQHSRHE